MTELERRLRKAATETRALAGSVVDLDDDLSATLHRTPSLAVPDVEERGTSIRAWLAGAAAVAVVVVGLILVVSGDGENPDLLTRSPDVVEPTTLPIDPQPEAVCLDGLVPEEAAREFLDRMIVARTSGDLNPVAGCLVDVPAVYTGEPPACWSDCAEATRTFILESFRVGESLPLTGESFWIASVAVTYETTVGFIDVRESWRLTPIGEAYEIGRFSIESPITDREVSRATIAEYLGFVERGEWLEASRMMVSDGIDPSERSDLQRLSPESFTQEGIALALERWCSGGCDTAAPTEEELTLVFVYGLSRGGERIEAAWFEGLYSISGLPFRTGASTAVGTIATPRPSESVLETVGFLASGWEAVPLDRVATGSPRWIASTGERQVIIGESPSGCCFKNVDAWARSSGEGWTVLADSDEQFGSSVATENGLPRGLGHGPRNLAVVDGVFVASGAFQRLVDVVWRETPMVWQSVDGVRWESTALPGSGVATSLVETGRGLLVLVDDLGVSSRLWESADGVTWSELASLDAGDRRRILQLDRVADRLIVHEDEGRVRFVSDDEGRTWAEPTGELANPDGRLLPTAAGALLLRGPQSFWSSDGLEWMPIGLVEPPPVLNSDSNFPGGLLNVVALGEVVVLSDGSNLWVTDDRSPWVQVPKDRAFADVPSGTPWISELGLIDSGDTLVALGAVPAPALNKPVGSYMVWTHAGQ
jgi:hypothetical protein